MDAWAWAMAAGFFLLTLIGVWLLCRIDRHTERAADELERHREMAAEMQRNMKKEGK